MVDEKIITNDQLESRITTNSKDGVAFQERKAPDWRENYELYRDKVIVNRLINRQTVNIPLTKQIVKTILSKIDDFIDLEFVNLDNNKQKELFYNLFWSDVVKVENKLELKDKVDKKQVAIFGRTFEKLNVMGGHIKLHIIDPRDMRVDRYIDPTDIDTARYIIQDNIFESLNDLKQNSMYDQAAVKKIEDFFSSEQGLVKAQENQEQFQEKVETAQEMGDIYANNPLFGQTIVQMQESFTKVYNPEIEEDEIIFAISGNIQEDGMPKSVVLFSDTLENVIDANRRCKDHFWRYHYPLESWAEDLENQDFWSDSVADVCRPANKVANAWYSQEIEARTMAGFGMNYFDSTAGGEDGAFIPQTFEPKAWGWYPIPGNPNELIKRVEISPLDGNMEAINWVVSLAEKASAATAITQGVSEQKKITLGEVEILAGNALDRIQSMSLYYQQAWLNIGRKYVKLMEAMGDDIEGVKLFKQGYLGNVYSQVITPASWRSANGYDVKVISKKDKSEQDLEQIQKLQAVQNFLPNNKALGDVMKKKLLDIGGLNPDEIKLILDEDKKMQEAMINAPIDPNAIPTNAGAVTTPQTLPLQ